MVDFALMKDIDALITQRIATPITSIGNAPTLGTNNTPVAGIILQRSLINMPLCCAPTILWSATLLAAATLSLSYLIEHSADGVSWSNYQYTNPAGQLITGAVNLGAVATGAGTFNGQFSTNVDLTAAKDYVRFTITPNLSSVAAGNLASITSELSFAGFNVLPALQ
jgi:hypothetical protein